MRPGDEGEGGEGEGGDEEDEGEELTRQVSKPVTHPLTRGVKCIFCITLYQLGPLLRVVHTRHIIVHLHHIFVKSLFLGRHIDSVLIFKIIYLIVDVCRHTHGV